MGGRGKIFFKKVPISIWELRKSRGGVLIFQKCPNFNYFAIILQYYLYKKCLKIKNVWIWSEGGGGQQFSKMSEIQKSLKFPMGRGGQAYLGIFPKFFRFIFMMAPLDINLSAYPSYLSI